MAEVQHNHHVCMFALLLQLCLSLCNPMNCILQDSSVHGILQAGMIAYSEWCWICDLWREFSFRIRDEASGTRSFMWQKFESESERLSFVSDSLRPHGLHRPWNSPGQNTGVGSLSLLQGIFPTQGSNPGLPHGRWILYQLSHQGSPYSEKGMEKDSDIDIRKEQKSVPLASLTKALCTLSVGY